MKHNTKTVLASFLISAVAMSGANAQEMTALVGGRLIDGFGHATIQDSVILINDDTILKVGTVESLAVPDGYTVISTEGMDVLPGLWESHAHLMLTGHADYPHCDALVAVLRDGRPITFLDEHMLQQLSDAGLVFDYKDALPTVIRT